VGEVERNSDGHSNDSSSDNVNEEKKRQEAAGSRLSRSVRQSVGRHSPVGRWWGGGGWTNIGWHCRAEGVSLSLCCSGSSEHNNVRTHGWVLLT